MNTKVLILFGLLAFVAADKRPSFSYGVPAASEEASEEFEAPKYDFDWTVNDDSSSNEFGHEESRDDENTQGSYYVQLPDGRLQKVTYYVDGDNGYVADVTYEGEAQFPESDESREAPVYSPPRNTYGVPQ